MKIDLMRCDVCGTEYDSVEGIHLDVQLQKKYCGKTDPVGIDICPICRQELVDWLKELENGRGED
jgi:hypothetical protein